MILSLRGSQTGMYLPAYGLDDTVQLVVGGRVAAPHGKHQVDGIKQAREGFGEVCCFVRLQRVFQSLFRAAHTHKEIATKNIQIIFCSVVGQVKMFSFHSATTCSRIRSQCHLTVRQPLKFQIYQVILIPTIYSLPYIHIKHPLIDLNICADIY